MNPIVSRCRPHTVVALTVTVALSGSWTAGQSIPRHPTELVYALLDFTPPAAAGPTSTGGV